MDQSPNPRRGYSFPIARRVLAFVRTALSNWRERHQHPFNFAIHLLGIPLTLIGVGVFFFYWHVGVALFLLGYLLQFIGHRVEGNTMGELVPIKRLLGLPYVTISPRRREHDHLPG